MTSASPGTFFSNQGTLTVAGTGGTPAAGSVLAIQNVTITPKHDTVLARVVVEDGGDAHRGRPVRRLERDPVAGPGPGTWRKLPRKLHAILDAPGLNPRGFLL